MARHVVERVIVRLPAEIDITNSEAACQQLCSACTPGVTGVTGVIADLTATTFCDCSAVRGLLLARRHAAAGNIEFRLACASHSVLRVIDLLGLGDHLVIYPSLSAALNPAAAPVEPVPAYQPTVSRSAATSPTGQASTTAA